MEKYQLEDFVQEENRVSSPSPPLSPPVVTKPKEKKKENEVSFAWRDDLVCYMINKWQGEPTLYNKNSGVLYHDDKTKQALAVTHEVLYIVLHALLEFGTESPSWSSIRFPRGSQGSQGGGKYKQSGTTTDAVYTPKWQYYKSLMFFVSSSFYSSSVKMVDATTIVSFSLVVMMTTEFVSTLKNYEQSRIENV